MASQLIFHSICFKSLSKEDIPTIVSAFAALGWAKTAAMYEMYLEEQSKAERNIWVAWNGDAFLGYVTLLWQSEYQPFSIKDIPEIKDLNVLPQFRNQGIGSHLMDLAEETAHQKGKLVGLSVGLTADYGSAQKLYVKRGYCPDGQGITHQYKSVPWGESVQVDDDSVLWLVKKIILNNSVLDICPYTSCL